MILVTKKFKRKVKAEYCRRMFSYEKALNLYELSPDKFSELEISVFSECKKLQLFSRLSPKRIDEILSEVAAKHSLKSSQCFLILVYIIEKYNAIHEDTDAEPIKFFTPSEKEILAKRYGVFQPPIDIEEILSLPLKVKCRQLEASGIKKINRLVQSGELYLTEKEKQLINLRYGNKNMTYEKIAKIMDVSLKELRLIEVSMFSKFAEF